MEQPHYCADTSHCKMAVNASIHFKEDRQARGTHRGGHTTERACWRTQKSGHTGEQLVGTEWRAQWRVESRDKRAHSGGHTVEGTD